MRGFTRINILGCPFDAVHFNGAVKCIRDSVLTGLRLQIVPGSVDFVMKCMRDRSFLDVLRKADLVVADGVPIVWSASLLGTPLRGRVSGTELVWKCAEVSQETSCSVALVGGMPGVAERAGCQMEKRYPGAHLHVVAAPYPLRHEDSIEVAARIRAIGAKIVLLALGAPRQERWIQTYLDSSGAPVGIGIGSAFDIISGDKPRAPRWLQNLGLEWLHRTMLEPKRLGRRYFVEDMPFLLYLTRQVIKQRLSFIGELK